MPHEHLSTEHARRRLPMPEFVVGAVLGISLGIAAAIRALTGTREAEIPVPVGAGEKPTTSEWQPESHEPGQESPGTGLPVAMPLPPARAGWTLLPHEPLPRPTYWPAVISLGIVFLLWGIVTTYLISLVGLVLIILALAGWIREIMDERAEHERAK